MLTPSLPRLGRGMGERRGKAKYRFIQALKADIRLAAVVAHPGRPAPQHLHSTSPLRSLSGGAGSQRDAPGSGHNFHVVLPTTLFLLITSAIAKRRTREERAGRLANPPAREGREWGGSRVGGAAVAAAAAVKPRAT